MSKKFKPLVLISAFLAISSIGFSAGTQATLEASYRQAQAAVNRGLGKCLSEAYSLGARSVEDYIRRENNKYFSDISFISGGRVTVKLLPRSRDIDEETYEDLADFYRGEAYTRCNAALSEFKRGRY
jgi:hypothetical protein